MRSIHVAAAIIGWLLSACGSSSDSALFGNTSANCASSSRCISPGAGGSSGISGAGGESAIGGSAAAAGVQQSASGGTAGSGGGSGAASSGGTAGEIGSGGSPTATCPVGSYHAVLTGSYRTVLGSNDIGATIDFSVGATGDTTGSFVGRGTAKASVTGSLDCSSGSLTARIENGSYQFGLQQARFSGTFDGTYDPGTTSFDGTWNITETDSATNGGNGPWSTR